MLPCSEVHWKILPSVCRQLALCMETEGVSRARIADALGTSQAAVSQYISGKRGAGKLPMRAENECGVLAKKYATGKVKASGMDVGISMIVVIAKGSTLGKRDPCAICMGGVPAKKKKR
jgi:predicted transcriptional regulator